MLQIGDEDAVMRRFERRLQQGDGFFQGWLVGQVDLVCASV
jgi:hypothetical protein